MQLRSASSRGPARQLLERSRMRQLRRPARAAADARHRGARRGPGHVVHPHEHRDSGPRARDLLARRQAAVPAGLGRATDVVVERAEGALVFDVDGNTLIDFAAASACWPSGTARRGRRRDRRAGRSSTCITCALVSTYEPYVRLAELLNEITPGDFAKKTIFANSGAEAVENAVKLARKYTGRAGVVCFEGGYHGRTLLTLSLTSKYGLFKSGFGPFAPEIVRLPIPAPLSHARGDDRRAVRRLRHPPARARADRAGRSGGARGDDHRAGAGRGGLHPGAAALPRAHPRAVHAARHRDDRRRSAVRLRSHGAAVRRRALRHRARSRHDREVARRRHADRRRRPAAPRSWTPRISAASAARTAAARSRAPRRSKRSRSSASRRFSRMRAGSATSCAKS